MNEITCPKTGLRCFRRLCENYEAVKAALFEQNLVAARLKLQADDLGLTPEEAIVHIEGNPAYHHAVEKTIKASHLYLCTPVCRS